MGTKVLHLSQKSNKNSNYVMKKGYSLKKEVFFVIFT